MSFPKRGDVSVSTLSENRLGGKSPAPSAHQRPATEGRKERSSMLSRMMSTPENSSSSSNNNATAAAASSAGDKTDNKKEPKAKAGEENRSDGPKNETEKREAAASSEQKPGRAEPRDSGNNNNNGGDDDDNDIGASQIDLEHTLHQQVPINYHDSSIEEEEEEAEDKEQEEKKGSNADKKRPPAPAKSSTYGKIKSVASAAKKEGRDSGVTAKAPKGGAEAVRRKALSPATEHNLRYFKMGTLVRFGNSAVTHKFSPSQRKSAKDDTTLTVVRKHGSSIVTGAIPVLEQVIHAVTRSWCLEAVALRKEQGKSKGTVRQRDIYSVGRLRDTPIII